MKQSFYAFDAVVNLTALQKCADIEDIYGKVPENVTEIRRAMLYAMERHDVRRIHELMDDLEEKIEQKSGALPSVGYYMCRRPLDSDEVKAYRDVIHIGRLALQGLSPKDKAAILPKEPVKRWDA